MGLPWIKVYTDLPEHPKSLDLGDALGNPLAWAHVVQLWGSAARFWRAGVVPRARIERAAGWTGPAVDFISAALKVGFLDEIPGDESHLAIHDWDVTQQAHLEKAERDAADKARKRRAQKARQTRAESSLEERRGDREEKKTTTAGGGSPSQAPPAADRQLPPHDQRVTGRELRELWNRAASPPARIPTWEAMPPGQEMQADALALEFDRATWVKAFDLVHRSAFLNGRGKQGWLLTPAKLLKGGRSLVEALLNGEYSGGKDLPAGQAPPTTGEACNGDDRPRCRNHRDRPSIDVGRELCGECCAAELRAEP
jgi:hypothetical protein